MSETQKDTKIQDLPAKPVTRDQGEAVKGGAQPVGGKQPVPKPAMPISD